jgi:xylulokinase
VAAVLAIDLGTGGPKVALVAPDGRVLDREREPVGLRVLPGGGVEQSPAEWWRATAAASRRLAARAGGEQPLTAVAVTAQWAGTVAVDAGGEQLCDALIWMDARGAPFVRRAVGGPVRVAGYGPLHLARWLRRTGGAPALSGRDPFGHILFLKHEHPQVYADAALLLEPADWLGLKLSGRAATTGVTATLHWLTNTRDLDAIRYDPRLIRAAGIDAGKLPELLPTNSVLGPLTEPAARELGVAPGAPVIAGTPDTMSAAVGSGAVADGAAHLYVGTSSWLSCHVDFKRTDPLRGIASLPSALPGRYLVSDEQETAGASLERLRDIVAPGGGDEAIAALLDDAATAPPGAGSVLFAPWLNGERTPVDDHLVRGGWFNIGMGTTRAEVARATLEGVALNTRWMQRPVERFAKRRLDPIAFVGGGARSGLWCQIMADVLDREIRQMADPTDVNLRGAALLAGLALGELRVEDLAERVPVEATYTPRPETKATYDKLFEAFRGLYKSTRGLYRSLNS